MMSHKARILDIKGDKAVVFTSRAEFKQISLKRHHNAKVGDEIEMPAIFSKRYLNTINVRIGLVAAVLAIALLVTIVATHSPAQAQIVRYYSVDINPSIELAADINDTVISAEAKNEDGNKVLENLDLQGMKATDAITSIAQEAANQGFIQPGQENDIVITVTDVTSDSSSTSTNTTNNNATDINSEESSETGSGNENSLPDEDTLTDQINNALASARLTVKVEVLTAKSEMRQAAQEQGISVGKYAILTEAQNQGLNITVDDIKQQSIRKAIEAAGGDFKTIVLAAKRDSNLGQAMKAFNQERKADQEDNDIQSDDEQQAQETNTSQNQEQEQIQVEQSTQTRQQNSSSGDRMVQEQNQVQVRENTQLEQKNKFDKSSDEEKTTQQENTSIQQQDKQQEMDQDHSQNSNGIQNRNQNQSSENIDKPQLNAPGQQKKLENQSTQENSKGSPQAPSSNNKH